MIATAIFPPAGGHGSPRSALPALSQYCRCFSHAHHRWKMPDTLQLKQSPGRAMRLALRREKDLPSSQNTKLKTENCYSENKSDGLRCLSSTDSAQSYRPKERPELKVKLPTLQVYHRRPVSKSQGPERGGPDAPTYFFPYV